jgi:hypothetical protein
VTRVLRYASKTIQPLQHNSAHNFAANYALSIYPSDSVCSFIPKNACSTLRYSIAMANGVINGPQDFNWIHHNNVTFRASLRDLIKAKYTFVIIRDPFLRLTSCYLDKMVDQNDVAWFYHRLLQYARPPSELTFRQFVTQLSPHLRANEHWRPQIDFLIYTKYDEIFCHEDFVHIATVLLEKIDFTLHDTRVLSKHGTDRYLINASSQCFSDMNALELLCLKRSGTIPSLNAFYDDELIKLVHSLYHEDIQFYETFGNKKTVFSKQA